jgi:hypothetical protein
MHLLIRIVSVFVVAHVLCGCGRPETGIPIGGDFELVLRNADSVLHKPGNLRLYQLNASGHKILVWPYVTGSRIVTDKMVIFNGGLTDDRRWGVYPALFVYRRDTGTLEVSKAISRLALRDLAAR